MNPLLHPRLINSPFDDPGLFVSLSFEKRAFLFDLGDVGSLSARDALKISHVFISHTHMDHFIGFDQLIRLFLGREKTLYIYGPQGFLSNLEGKLAGYCWNLVDHYDTRLILHATEIHPAYIISKQYPCRNKFIPILPEEKHPFNGTLLKEPVLAVSSIILNHGTPCLGFSLKERFHVNIMKDKVDELGLAIGPWLREFKQALYSHQDPESTFEITCKTGPAGLHRVERFVLKDLTERIALITPGQKVTYITDVGGTPSNMKKIIEFAKDSDHLFIEAAFLHQHENIARDKFHLTARQAGTLAKKAGARQFSIFHFSPRYTDQGELLQEEAMAAFLGE
ncbi:MAG: MBL fold metallo-hydrolase [Desulfobacterales bacterium]|nr:MBL fold metallo-hydrolase [Desulfobacterales bacterium]MDD4073212.1 MBL fold metallo-hydrolase [Desulfobacterales bacterium]MDD4392304.1 MBL fold metallo-hydrolase [Desulfobacterales bacterium]